MFCSYDIRGVELGFDRTDATCIYGKGFDSLKTWADYRRESSVCSTAIGVMAIKALLIGVLQGDVCLEFVLQAKVLGVVVLVRLVRQWSKLVNYLTINRFDYN